MKNNISILHLPKVFRFIFLLVVMLSALYAGGAPSARAQTPPIVLVPGTVTVSGLTRQAVISALEGALDLPSTARYFSVSDLRLDGDWALASIIGLARVHSDHTWSIDDGAWFGVVLLKQGQDGKWTGATQGTPAFSALIDETPDIFVDSTSKRGLDPLTQPSIQGMQATSAYAFPWQSGTYMFYGTLGIHANGFNSVVTGWKAVDMMSDGIAPHAPNQLLAAEAGTITYKCTDSHNIAIHLGDFFYTHIANIPTNPSLDVGTSFVQKAPLGSLKTGSFTGPCGWADQPSNWFHVHWGFPSGDLHVEDWTLSMKTGDWTNGTQTVGPGDYSTSWLMAGSTDPCPGPVLSAPVDGFVSASQTISFTWSAVSGCVFKGYRFRIKTVPTMDSGGTTIVSIAPATTSVTRVIPSDWNKQDLYWGVKAINAPFGSSWSVGHFSIDPTPAVPTDYGLCSNEGQVCAFSGTAQLYYGISSQSIGPFPFTDGVTCSTDAFGSDPVPGTAKQCFIKGGQPQSTTWCAKQNGTCSFGPGNVATVYYGLNGMYSSKTNVVTSITCSNTNFVDPYPGLAKACYYVITGSTAGTQTLYSIGGYDGLVVETTETSSLGGGFDAFGSTFSLGDDANNDQVRGFLSFDTSGLPDNAILTSVTLKLKKAGITGTSPYASLGNILVDIRTGAFSKNLALQSTDFSSPPTKGAALTILNTPVSGVYSASLPAANFVYINLTGPTQMRLRFAIGDNNNLVADLMTFFSGDQLLHPARRPSLTINYYLPQVP